jgi:hypothetical protein
LPKGAAETSDLTLRQHQRVRCAIACPLTIASEHAGAVQLATGTADANGNFEGTLVDLSRGGAGVRTGVFLPKQTRFIARVPHAGGTLVLNLKVMRVQMIDKTPRYELGTALTEATPEMVARVGAVIQELAREQELGAVAGVAGGVGRG